MNRVQQDTANTLIGVGKGLGADGNTITACIFDAIYESSLGVDLTTNGGGYGGVLGGLTSIFGDVRASAIAMATSWYKGGNGFHPDSGGGIAESKVTSNIAALGSFVTDAAPLDAQGISTQYEGQNVPGGIQGTVNEATAIVRAWHGGAISVISGTSANATASATTPFYVGDSANPDEDVWTAINRIAQERQWYLFSDGEIVYLADGIDLLQQPPALTLDRVSDSGNILSLDFTWDNTAFQYTSKHKRRGRTQRKSVLPKVVSPTEGHLQVICDIDSVRGGDTVVLSGCGPGDGAWLVGDCTRSIFQVYSDLTLVPGVQPLTEAQAEGGTSANAITPFNKPVGKTSAKPGTGNLAGYYNPVSGVSGLTAKDIDEGVDYSGSGPIVAIADGKIGSTTSTGWPGGTFIEQSITNGPYAGKFWYYAENITPSVSGGQTVVAGQTIGVLHDAYPNMETGWGAGNGGDALARQLGQSPRTTAAGVSANRLLTALGAPSGNQVNTPNGSMPAGFP